VVCKLAFIPASMYNAHSNKYRPNEAYESRLDPSGLQPERGSDSEVFLLLDGRWSKLIETSQL
jgi:hypothetical protein